MGRLKCLINTTPDGFVDGQYLIIDAEYFEFVRGLMEGSEAAVFGRKTFEQFQNVWPARLASDDTPDWQMEMAKALHAIPKRVYSSTIQTTVWNHSTIITALDREEINKIKQSDRRDLITFGSVGLVADLSKKNLVDDYYFCIQPMIAGRGNLRLFDKINLNSSISVRLLSSRILASGVIILHYTVQ